MSVDYSPNFARIIKKLKDAAVKAAGTKLREVLSAFVKRCRSIEFTNTIKNQMRKAIENPKSGKPMRFSRLGTRELYIAPFRLSYIYIKSEDRLVFLDLYHKDEQ